MSAARRIFEQQSETSPSAIKRPLSKSTVGSPSSRGKKPAASKKDVNIVLAFLWWRKACKTYQRQQQLASAALIQEEFRGYLNRTQGVREILRQRRRAANEIYVRNVALLINTARHNGSRLCIAEAEERHHLATAWIEESVLLLINGEASERQNVIAQHRTSFEEVMAKDAPKIFVSGTIEHDEFEGRRHVAKLQNYSFDQIQNVFWNELCIALSSAERTARLHNVSEECAVRLQSLRLKRQSFSACRMIEEQNVETKLRAAWMESRAFFMASLTQKKAIILMEELLGHSDFCEQAERIKLEDQRYSELRTFFFQFHQIRCRYLLREAVEEEALKRKGYKGISHMEQVERGTIVGAVVKLKLQMLQGDDILDVQTECGSRKAIEWLESRQRHDLMCAMAATSMSLLLPNQELYGRKRLQGAEWVKRQQIVSSLDFVDYLAGTQEPHQRRCIFRSYCRGLSELLLTGALLRLQSQQENQRIDLLEMHLLQKDFYASREYLEFIQLKEFLILLGYFERMTSRLMHTKKLLDSVKAMSPIRNNVIVHTL